MLVTLDRNIRIYVMLLKISTENLLPYPIILMIDGHENCI